MMLALTLSWVLQTTPLEFLFPNPPAIEIELGIRGAIKGNHIQAKKFPLAFRVRNSGTGSISPDLLRNIFLRGRLQISPPIAPSVPISRRWRTALWALAPGKRLVCPVYADLLDYFPNLPDGRYEVRWKSGELTSNALEVVVLGGASFPVQDSAGSDSP